ncbi:casein kinase II, alpha subunit [Reticulomyxa filosa]|uniref:non-specific serine/threonine protein kinase n=1 Tax=Reticulomyxa filosa TaxID=46433 RepID=X6N5H2_RETFI|nr:casein kinase II, alpha subunit [Reticulomyxa filosa]|eukprot:ETO21266.1 casein kinase II, alpha subunit [Reticulomyxa filosa]
MHRDVKPQNILVDDTTKSVRIIDWGLGAFYYPGHKYTVRVATRAYKAPELLVNYDTYHYAIDIWAFGAMFAGIIFDKQYFFHGRDLEEQLEKTIEVLGTDEFNVFMKKYHIPRPAFVDSFQYYEKKEWKHFMSDNAEKNKFITRNAIDLLEKMLCFDPNQRLTAKEAMQHPYFKKVRDQIAKQNQADATAQAPIHLEPSPDVDATKDKGHNYT